MNILINSIIAITLAAMTNNVFAQDMNNETKKNNKVSQEERISYRSDQIAAQLGLDDKSATKFKDIYSHYAKDLQALQPERQQKAENKLKDKKSENFQQKVKSDAEIDKQNKEEFTKQRARIGLEEQYYNEFRKVLSARQTDRVMKQDRFGQMQRMHMMQGKSNQIQGNHMQVQNMRNNLQKFNNRDNMQHKRIYGQQVGQHNRNAYKANIDRHNLRNIKEPFEKKDSKG